MCNASNKVPGIKDMQCKFWLLLLLLLCSQYDTKF